MAPFEVQKNVQSMLAKKSKNDQPLIIEYLSDHQSLPGQSIRPQVLSGSKG